MTWVFLGGCGLAAVNAWWVSRLKKDRRAGKDVPVDENNKIITKLDPVIGLLFRGVILWALAKSIHMICTLWIGWWFW